MAYSAHDMKRGDCLMPTDPALLGNPLVFIHEDHLREREICTVLDRIAGAPVPDRNDVDGALAFLRNELPLHLEDEEQDLFPLLKRRCGQEDEIDKVIARLESDHQHADIDTPEVVHILGTLAPGAPALSDAGRSALRDYAAHARRHLILENAIILPFARVRLTADDLQTLRLRMQARRGIETGSEAPHAQ